jgi:hypothetical protein
LRVFVRYLVAICIGVAGTLAWQAYGKQIVATRAPELGWSPEVKQTIASWTKPLAGPENTAAQPDAVAPTPAASIDPEQVKQMAQSLDELRQTVGQLAAAQEQFGREMTRLQAADQEILARIPAPPPPPSPPTAPTRKPPGAPPQRTPTTSPRP